MSEFNELQGKTIAKIKGGVGSEYMEFDLDSGEEYELFHIDDCCESVSIEDICGDLSDLIGSPILSAEEVVSHENPPDVDMKDRYQESFTWTFYKLSTIKGSVTIRWYGASNGYYSERVDFIKRK